jgi:hypothetical protein
MRACRPDRETSVGPLRAVSSAVEHTLHTRGVTGSIPVPPTSESRSQNRGGKIEATLALIGFCLGAQLLECHLKFRDLAITKP